METYDSLKLFAVSNQLLDLDLNNIEARYGIDLGRGTRPATQADTIYYPQIETHIRSEAAAMAPHYEVFYSLEKTIRSLVSSTIEAVDGADWWRGERVPERIRSDVLARVAKERDSAVTLRSDDEIDFSTFGELTEIIKSNWDLFSGMLSSKRAVERVMAQLNTLRGPIAHCSALAEDEIVRLGLAVRDWFRLMD